ncbi:MAG: histidine phosphatase family protein [Dehalococcoidia bacterium]
MTTEPAVPLDPFREYFRDVFLIGHPEATRLYFVRHGQAGNNIVGLELDPNVDPPLTELGFEQARRVSRRLEKQGVDRIYASTLLRARQTAEPLAAALGLEVAQVHDLREIELHNVQREDTEEYRQRVRDAMAERASWDALPGAEPSAEVRRRVTASVDAIVAANPGKRVAVFCHGGVIQIYAAIILGLRDDLFFYAFNAGIMSVRALGERRTLWRLNDISHLEETSNIS